MESLSLCYVAGFVLFLKTLLQLPIPDLSKYTEGVVGDRKNDAIMTWVFQTVWTYVIP